MICSAGPCLVRTKTNHIGRWGRDICPCCDNIHCCTGAWKNDKPLPKDDYAQEAQQRQLERNANQRLYDEEANINSTQAYPPAQTMAVPASDAKAPAAAPPTYQ